MQQDNIPNQQPQNPYTIDYLNQIAPKQKQPFFDKKMGIVLGVLLVVVILFGGIMMFSSMKGDSNSDSLLRTYLKVQKTNELVVKYQNRLKNSDLRAINSGLSTTLASDEAKLKTMVDGQGIKVPKIEKNKTPPRVMAEVLQETDDLDKVLDDAFLNAVLDRTYAREMNYQMGLINSLTKRVKSMTQSKVAKETLDEIIKSLDVSAQQLGDYSQSDK